MKRNYFIAIERPALGCYGVSVYRGPEKHRATTVVLSELGATPNPGLRGAFAEVATRVLHGYLKNQGIRPEGVIWVEQLVDGHVPAEKAVMNCVTLKWDGVRYFSASRIRTDMATVMRDLGALNTHRNRPGPFPSVIEIVGHGSAMAKTAVANPSHRSNKQEPKERT